MNKFSIQTFNFGHKILYFIIFASIVLKCIGMDNIIYIFMRTSVDTEMCCPKGVDVNITYY